MAVGVMAGELSIEALKKELIDKAIVEFKK